MVSRSIRDIVADAQELAKKGVKEMILIAQDSTVYGRDLGLSEGLPALLSSILKEAADIPWIRIMYSYPGAISDALIRMMEENDQLIHYLDMPLQHASEDVLKRMHRPHNIEKVKRTIRRLRSSMPDIALRTTFITGFPGETIEEFEELVQFIEEIEFDHVGIFRYYHEEGTASYLVEDDIPEDEKNERVQTLAEIQERISLKKNQSLIGENIPVLVEGNGDGISIGRSYRDAPEIDGLVLFKGIIETGELINAKVTDALVHDLIAVKKSVS
jgi:ribosomal protein S12 methylthiotransferase